MPHATVLIAEDHAAVREHLVTLLKDAFDIVGAVGDGKLMVEATLRLAPDVVVADMVMPGFTALEALRVLASAHSHAKVIVFTMHAEPEIAREAMRLGALGFVSKLAPSRELITAINEVLQGRSYMTPSVQSQGAP